MDYCLIKNGIVINTIVADEAFIEKIKADYDAIIECPPGVGVCHEFDKVNLEFKDIRAPGVKDEERPRVKILKNQLIWSKE